jgi:flavodoxin
MIAFCSIYNKSRGDCELKELIIYWSATGNTEKVAHAIENALAGSEISPVLRNVTQADGEELYDYDLVFLGSPVYQFLPAEPVLKFIKEKMKVHNKRGDIKLCAPTLPGKNAVVFCTYSGPHTGIREAIPADEYMGQFFEHLGFNVADKYYVVGEFNGRPELSTKGKLGDIIGRPNQQDLAEIESKVRALIGTLQCSG